MENIIQQSEGTESPEGNEMRVTLFASAPNRNRVWYKGKLRQLQVDPMGMLTASYLTNAVFLYQHDDQERLPIGRMKDIKQTSERATGTVVFDMDDEFAQAVRGKYERGFMNAVSISHRPMEASLSKDGKIIHITQTELREVSAVSIPADPNALKQSLESILDAHEDAQLDDVVAPVDDVEADDEVLSQADIDALGKVTERILLGRG